MLNSVLVGFASGYGSIQEVAEAIATTLREGRLAVDIQPVRVVRTLTAYEAVVLGAPLFMFHWHKEAINFLSRHRGALIKRPVAAFALGPVQDPHDEQEWQDSWAQLDKELAKLSWFKPIAIEMFGGKYDPDKLRFPLKCLPGKSRSATYETGRRSACGRGTWQRSWSAHKLNLSTFSAWQQMSQTIMQP